MNQDNKKLLNIVICTRNRNTLLLRLLKSLILIPDFDKNIEVFIINDNSNQTYNDVNVLINSFINIHYIYNEIQLGKVKSILTYKNLFNGKYILTLDDKDDVIDPSFFKVIYDHISKAVNNEIFIGYYQNKNGYQIGKSVKDGETYAEFYFKSGNIGDHMFFIPEVIFDTFGIPEKLKQLVINDELVYLQYIFNLKNYNFNVIKPFILHNYSEGNLTKNIFENKINNWIITRYTAFLVLKQNPCLKVRIVKLFEIFLTRKKAKLTFSNKSDKLLYLSLYLSCSFVFIKKIYKRKIEEIIS